MGSRLLSDLTPAFRAVVVEFLAATVEAGIPVRIIETRRSPEEHHANVARNKSWTKHSRHCDGEAIDICPTALLDKPNWAPEDQLWQRLGSIAEGMGMGWGGRWTQKDMCHFEAGQD